MTGRPAFPGNGIHEILLKNKKGDVPYPPKYWDKISGDGKDLVAKMLHKDPRIRISAREALAHSWFNPENKSVSENVLLEVSANIANLRQEMNIDMRQMNNADVDMVTCTPLIGRRQLIMEPASPLLPMGGNRDATPLMRV